MERTFRLVDNFLRDGDPKSATGAADRLILGSTLGEEYLKRGLHDMNATLRMLRSQRQS